MDSTDFFILALHVIKLLQPHILPVITLNMSKKNMPYVGKYSRKYILVAILHFVWSIEPQKDPNRVLKLQNSRIHT